MVSFEGKVALIVDDDEVSVDVLGNLLERLEVGYLVADGMSDIQTMLTDAGHIDIVFLDLEMPGRNGYDVLALLDEHPVAAGVPIVAYTTHISHVNDAKQAGFHSFLGKPLNRRDFPDLLERILGGESVWEIP